MRRTQLQSILYTTRITRTTSSHSVLFWCSRQEKANQRDFQNGQEGDTYDFFLHTREEEELLISNTWYAKILISRFDRSCNKIHQLYFPTTHPHISRIPIQLGGGVRCANLLIQYYLRFIDSSLAGIRPDLMNVIDAATAIWHIHTFNIHLNNSLMDNLC